MADIFVSYTSADRDWAFWIGQQLEKLGHVAHVHEWEVSGGGDISAWMEKHHHGANHVLCVISEAYLKAPYSSWERRAAQWVATTKRPNFTLPVLVESCELPTLLEPLKRCDLHGLNEDAARARFAAFMTPAAKPAGPVPFPGSLKLSAAIPNAPVPFPGGPRALSNIPIAVPRFFLGRDEVLAEIKTALAADQGRVAITALYGMRGVGKTTLAVAYADFHRSDYRATWWIRAETESTMRADLVGLGVRVGWVAPEEREEPALATVMERLRHEGRGILLIFDNAIDADSVEPYFPNGGDAELIITSNAHVWRDVASPKQIDTWPCEIGAEYLVSRTGRKAERQAALALSKALGGLPLAHEQAAAYCERLEVPFATYQNRCEAAPVSLLDDGRDAPRAYHNRLTVAKTFALAIDEAAKLHPAAEPLIVYAALLAPQPVPLFLFREASKRLTLNSGGAIQKLLRRALAFLPQGKFGSSGDIVDEAVAALRSFALIDREPIPDERDSAVITDCIRLHRLVQQVAAARRVGDSLENARRELIDALLEVYPGDIYNDPRTWPRVRRLDAHALALVGHIEIDPKRSDLSVANLLDKLDSYRDGVLSAYAEARGFSERALAIREKELGPDHPETARSLSNLSVVVEKLGDVDGSLRLSKRALAVREKALGPNHPVTARSLNNIGFTLYEQGDLAGARPFFERALAIREKVLGADDPDTALSLNNLGALFQARGDHEGARPLFERALAIRKRVLGADHPNIVYNLNNLGGLLIDEMNLEGALS